MFRSKNKVTMILSILFITGVTITVLMQRSYKMNKTVFSATPPTIALPDPIQLTTMDSPDGTKTLTMKKQPSRNLANYSFFISSQSDPTEQLIFSKEEDVSQDLSIPYNTWSPDNTYVFLKESSSPQSSYYLLHSSGSSFPNSASSIEIHGLFKQKFPQFTLTDITGWAAPNLLIINTKTTQGEQGPSIWFDVTSQSFVVLSTRFN